jgi:hypothetical protein
MMQAFGVAKQQGGGSIEAYANAVAGAITEGGADATEAYALAFAEAEAAGGDERSGLAQATAVAFCQGASPLAFVAAAAGGLQRASLAPPPLPGARCHAHHCASQAPPPLYPAPPPA